jgi:hypothetical protein
VEDIHTTTSRSHPRCLKCGDAGHVVRDCRNGTMYFICEKLRHKSCRCRSLAMAHSPPIAIVTNTISKSPPLSDLPGTPPTQRISLSDLKEMIRIYSLRGNDIL